jgi:serine/threonine protein kinase
MFQAIFDDIAQNEGEEGTVSSDGAPSIPGYEIQYPLAATYSTTVYRAHSEELNTDVALKVCNSQPVCYGNYHQLSVRQEFDILRKLGGEYVAHAYEYGEIDNMAYMALEYFPNGCLSQYIRTNGRKISRVEYLLKVAKGLRDIHEGGFLHLDLKPNNVLIRENGSPALIDFGISKRILLARHQERQVFSLGSPYFMSPEQARGEPLDERSDIYSFGALWFRIFTGRVPFGGRTFDELRQARDGRAPSMGDVLRHYQPIVDKTLTPDRDERFASVEELIENIEYYASSATGIYRCLDLQEIQGQVSLMSA